MTTSSTPSEKPSLTDAVVVGAKVELDITELSIAEAATVLTDGKRFYLQTMPRVLAKFPAVTPKAYWELTVAEHAALVDWEG